MTAAKMPVLFVSHGSPMHALGGTDVAAAWAHAVRDIVPRAILMVSAHWDSDMPLLSGAAAPQTIHDFGGFPEELYRLQYPAAGAPEIAARARDLLQQAGIRAGIEGCRGLDHGAWVPLLHMYPKADVPVLQLSLQPAFGAAHHLALGQAIAPLRDEGVLIIGSGHMTHNLRDYMLALRGLSGAAGYAQQFRDWVDGHIHRGEVQALLDWESAPHALRAHPSAEHFLPLFVALGAAGAGYRAQSLFAGIEDGVLAMDAYRFD